ncbi:uncharacterized protein LOC142502680 isoform X1 [Ascaphus truei]|uniref:uncharacterized protein LOC142502680 isoform X1 n=1 Tax=Ascaphus truei TaxID=8439 RepID=UPI003F5A7884
MAALHCIVKLGGSAITDKDQRETLRPEALHRAGLILRRLCKEGLRCVLVHGAGSFGHFHAKEFRVAEGSAGSTGVSDTLRLGLCATRLSVTKLNQQVTEQLVAERVPAIGISLFGSWSTASGEVTRAGVSPVREALDAGYVPVLHGDCVLDSEKHCSVLSGDIVIQVLCSELHPRHVVFLMDVNGIYTCPPDTPGAELVRSVTVGADGRFSPAILTVARSNDVTGGAALKLRAAVAIVTQSKGTVEVLMCNIQSQAAEVVCITGNLPPGEGTRVTLAA